MSNPKEEREPILSAIQSILGNTTVVPFRPDFANIKVENQSVGTNGALALSVLFSLSKDELDWLEGVPTQLEQKLFFSRPTALRTLKSLEEMGLLQTKRAGMPAKSLYRLDLEAIQRAYEANQGEQNR